MTALGVRLGRCLFSFHSEQTDLRRLDFVDNFFCVFLSAVLFLSDRLQIPQRAGFISYLAYLATSLEPGVLWALGKFLVNK